MNDAPTQAAKKNPARKKLARALFALDNPVKKGADKKAERARLNGEWSKARTEYTQKAKRFEKALKARGLALSETSDNGAD